MATWWMHWEDLRWPDLDNLDKIKSRAEGFAKANVTAAMFFGAHFRWDFLPIFPLLHDYIATVAEELHRYGIKLFDHHSVNLVHRYNTREEMRRVMHDSGPHLPFSPTFESAKSWQYHGKYLNDWRMIDVRNGQPLWFPQYTAEGFCHRNQEFRDSYKDYVKDLISETGIDGLSADDAMYFMQYNACGCKYCREELIRRAGIDLPPVDDISFWGNWDNPAWHSWLDLRFDASGEFYEQLRAVLPDGFTLTGCGSNSASGHSLPNATDARQFLRGWNYVNMEMSGNTPPYKHDKLTSNVPVSERLINASHHQAAARERGVGAFCTGFAHSQKQANVVWSVSKMLGADAWIGTLKMRLGLPWHILNTLPSEENIVGEAFTFEANHEYLFSGNVVGQLGVYFSYETRNHTMWGNMTDGYYRDYSDILRLLFKSGISPHTIFDFPNNTDKYPLIILAGVARMNENETASMNHYLKAGGKIIVLGPTPINGCINSWNLPNKANILPDKFFTTVPDGIHLHCPEWYHETKIKNVSDSSNWQESKNGIIYNPSRPRDIDERSLIEIVQRYLRLMPINILSANGYLVTMLEDAKGITVQLVADDYDVDINHELDSIRDHRSRVNLLTNIAPNGIDGTIQIKTLFPPNVFMPFCDGTAHISMNDDICTVTVPKDCAHVILRFSH